MEKNKCPICGKPTRVWYGNARKDGLCAEHADMLKDNIIKLNSEGTYVYTKNNKPIEMTILKEQQNNKCIVCGEKAPYGLQCKTCYYETLDHKKQLDKNSTFKELNTYYYNLNGNLYRMENFEKIKNNCNKLMAIAILSKEIFNSNTLINKVKTDIEKIIEKKKPNENKKTTKEIVKQDSQQEKLISSQDGHYVKSKGESIIDDLLYSDHIVHAYSPIVCEIAITEEPAIEADWFIPIISNTKGIYIEYWGMTTEQYIKNKKRKIEQYKRNDIPLIEIQKDEPFEDAGLLIVNIKRQIKALAKKHYNLDWKN